MRCAGYVYMYSRCVWSRSPEGRYILDNRAFNTIIQNAHSKHNTYTHNTAIEKLIKAPLSIEHKHTLSKTIPHKLGNFLWNEMDNQRLNY